MASRTIILLALNGIFFGFCANSFASDESVADQIRNATVCIISADGCGSGSGIVTRIKGKKYILTANHVIRGEQYVQIVSLKDGSQAAVNKEAGWNLEHDIVSFHLPYALRHLPALPLLDGKLKVGAKVYLSGYPGGYYHLTVGKVAGFIKRGDQMLHTAPSSGGTSGGALVSEDGRLCGIHTASYTPRSSHYPNKSATPSSVVLRLARIHTR